MMHQRFEHLLKQAIGLDTNSVGTSAISRAVETRLRACEIIDLDFYWDHVTQDRAELQALVETVVVPETWFFRDREAFTAATNLIRAEWQLQPNRVFHLLSLPCSTGEEPYTMAMSLIDAGIPPANFRIDGIDISNKSIGRAGSGLYGRNSFRGSDISFRDRHFKETSQGFQISDAVRSSVYFSQGNLFELDLLSLNSFDVVFCRNLLIYFDMEDQKRAVSLLGRLLSQSGTLFIGHSESSVVLKEGFSPLRIPHAFAFKKPGKTPKARPAAETPPSTKKRPVARAEAPKPALPRPFSKSRVTSTVVEVKAAASIGIEDIQRAADRGDIDTALKLGVDMVKGGKPTVEALHLLAVICEAAGDVTAASNYYRKTLYLEPDHHEALTHYALLLERQGDTSGAQRIRDRARRVDAKRGV